MPTLPAELLTRFAAHGFVLSDTGGNCSALIRTADDGYEEVIVSEDFDTMAPTAMTDKVVVMDFIPEQPRGEYPAADETTRFTLADCLAALDNPSDEYYTLSLRLFNEFHKCGGVA